jgi:hypothetical protein
MKRLAITLLVILCVYGYANAANYYVLDGGTSSACTSWSDACDQLSTAENLAARGDTIYVGDGSYNGVTFNTATSGTTYIYIKKATASAHGTDTGWDNAYGDGVATFTSTGSIVWSFSTGYWDVDGVTGGGPTAWTTGHGFKLTSSNATYDYFVYFGANGSNNILRHIDIGNSSMPTPGCDRAIYSNLGADNNTFQYCYVHQIGDVGITIGDSSGWVFEYSRFDRLDRAGYQSEPTGTCGTIGASNHGAGFELTRTTTNMTIRYNNISNIEGSGWIGIYDTGNGAVDGLYIYGNIMHYTADYLEDVTFTDTGDVVTATAHGLANGNLIIFHEITTTTGITAGTQYFVVNRTDNTYQVAASSGGAALPLTTNGTGKRRRYGSVLIYNVSGTTEPIKNILIYNNTIYNSYTSTILGLTKDENQSRAHAESTGNAFKNNIIYNITGTPVYTMNTKDYNASDEAISGGTNTQTLSSDPFTDSANADFTLTGHTTAGTELGTPYNIDMLGNTRTTPDRGAYEYDGAADATAPTISSFTIGATGITGTMVFSETVIATNSSGFTLACNGGTGEGISYSSGSNSTTLTFTITGRAIETSETCTLDYATVANGIEDLVGNDLASIGDPISVTNSSEYTPTAVTYQMTPSLGEGGCYLSPTVPTSVVTGQTTVLTATCNNGWRPVWSGTCGGTASGTNNVTYTTNAITEDCGVTMTPTEILLMPW